MLLAHYPKIADYRQRPDNSDFSFIKKALTKIKLVVTR